MSCEVVSLLKEEHRSKMILTFLFHCSLVVLLRAKPPKNLVYDLVYVVEVLLLKAKSRVGTPAMLSSCFAFTHGWAWCRSLLVMITY